MENSKFKENILPVIVLVCICLVVTLALAGTYSVANPVIEENQQKAADEARMEVLPDSWSMVSSTAISQTTRQAWQLQQDIKVLAVLSKS